MSDKAATWSSYAGAVASIVASLTLTDVGVMVGIVTALLTWYGAHRHRRRQLAVIEARDAEDREYHAARMAALSADRRTHDEPVLIDRRRHVDDEP